MNTKTNTDLETEFFQAVHTGNVEEVKSLAGKSPELVRARDYNCFGGPPLNLVIFRHDQKMLKTLIELGADPNDKSDWGPGPWNAVQCALNTGLDELAQWLVERGADVGVHEAAGLGQVDKLTKLLDESPEKVHQPGAQASQSI